MRWTSLAVTAVLGGCAVLVALDTGHAQDDEPQRSPGLESVFHPVPSVANRLRSLRRNVEPARVGSEGISRGVSVAWP